jgi:multidrug efflux system outer membrane protein
MLASALAGCSLIPVYQQPASPVAAQWPTGPAYQGVPADKAGSSMPINWPGSNSLPTLPCSADSPGAGKQPRSARGCPEYRNGARKYQIQKANLFPSISASGSGTNQRISANSSSTGSAYISHSYSAASVSVLTSWMCLAACPA